MKIPGPEPRTDRELLDRYLWLEWCLTTAGDDDPPVPPEAVQGQPDASHDAIRKDWSKRRKDLLARLLHSMHGTTIGQAYRTLRTIVDLQSARIDDELRKRETEDPVERALWESEAVGEQVRREATITRTIKQALSVLPAESRAPRTDMFSGLDARQTRVLQMAVAIEAGRQDWESAGAPPAGLPRKTWEIEIDDH